MYYDSYLYNNIQLLYSMDEEILNTLRNMPRVFYENANDNTGIKKDIIAYINIDFDILQEYLKDDDENAHTEKYVREKYFIRPEFFNIIMNAYNIMCSVASNDTINFDKFIQIVSNLPSQNFAPTEEAEQKLPLNTKTVFGFTRMHVEGVDTIVPGVKSHSINGVTLLLHLIKLKDEVTNMVVNVTKKTKGRYYGENTTTITLRGKELGNILTEIEKNKQIMEILKIHAIDGPVKKDIFCKTYNNLEYEENKKFLIKRYFEAIYSEEAFKHCRSHDQRTKVEHYKQNVKLFITEEEVNNKLSSSYYYSLSSVIKILNNVQNKTQKEIEIEINKLLKEPNNELKNYFDHIVGEIGDTECLTSLKEILVKVLNIINEKLSKTKGGKRKSSKKSKKSKRKTKQKKAKKRTKRRKH